MGPSWHYRFLHLLCARDSDLVIETLEPARTQPDQHSHQGLGARPPNGLPKTRFEGARAV